MKMLYGIMTCDMALNWHLKAVFENLEEAKDALRKRGCLGQIVEVPVNEFWMGKFTPCGPVTG